MDAISATQLHERHRSLREKQSEALATRLHRAISWLRRAQMEGDDDTRFVHLWIALNAAYASDFDFDDSENFAAASDLKDLIDEYHLNPDREGYNMRIPRPC